MDSSAAITGVPQPPRVGGGLALLTTLRGFAEELPRGDQRRVVHQLADELERGADLTTALEAALPRLPRAMRTLLPLGLAKGRLGPTMEALWAQARQRGEARFAFWRIVSYPLVLSGLVLVVGLGAMTYLVPMFRRIFIDFDTELPEITLWVLNLSGLIVELGRWWPGLLGLAVVAGVWCAAFPAGRRWFRGVIRLLPGLGATLREGSLAVTAETLAILIDLELPLPQALRRAAELCDDPRLAADLDRAAEGFGQGRPAMEAAGPLPRSLRAIVSAERDRGWLVDALRTLGLMSQTRATIQTRMLPHLIEPMVIFLIGIGLFFVVVALFMPLVKLLNDLS